MGKYLDKIDYNNLMLHLTIYLKLHGRFISSVLEKKEIGRKIFKNLEPNNVQK